MTLGELMAAAAAAKMAGTDLTLTMPPHWKRPRRFPRIELLSINAAGEKNYSVKPQRILEWLSREIDESGGEK
jgi:hypothetical protein